MKKIWLAAVISVSLTAVGGARGQGPVELKVGDKAPEFTLPGTDDKTHRLADYKGRTVVLAWFPAAFTSG